MATQEHVGADLKKLFESGKLVLGEEKTMKLLKSGHTKKVFVATTCKAGICDDVKMHAKLAGVEVIELALTADEIGALCRKQFGVSIASVKD